MKKILLLSTLMSMLALNVMSMELSPANIIEIKSPEKAQEDRAILEAILQNQIEKKPIASLITARPNRVLEIARAALKNQKECEYFKKKIQLVDDQLKKMLMAIIAEAETKSKKHVTVAETLKPANAVVPKNEKPVQLEKSSANKNSAPIQKPQVKIANVPSPVSKQPEAQLNLRPSLEPKEKASKKAVQNMPSSSSIAVAKIKSESPSPSQPLLKMHYDIAPRALDAIAIDEVETIIGYRFKNKQLLVQALTARSKNAEKNYEQYEYLGDKVLDAVIAQLLVQEYPKADEGMLTGARDALVSQEPMAALCVRLGLHNYLQDTNSSIPISSLCDIIEAIIGTMYIDGGAEIAQNFVLKFFIPMVKDKTCPLKRSKIIQDAAKGLARDINYLWEDNSCLLRSNPGVGNVITNFKPACANTKKDQNRLIGCLAEREFIKTLPAKYQNSLVRLAIDGDYHPLTEALPKLSLAWQNGLQVNYRERLHTLLQQLNCDLPEYHFKEGQEGPSRFECIFSNLESVTIADTASTKAAAAEKVANTAYKKIQTFIIGSPALGKISNAANELDIANPINSLHSFCAKYGLEIPKYSQELNSKNGIRCILAAPWLATIIKGSAKSTFELSQIEAAKRVIALIKHLSVKFVDPKKLAMIDWHTSAEPTSMLIQLCQCIDFERPEIKTYYCEGLVTDPLNFKTTISLADKKLRKKLITSQKAPSAAQAQNDATKKAVQYMVHKIVKREIQSDNNRINLVNG